MCYISRLLLYNYSHANYKVYSSYICILCACAWQSRLQLEPAAAALEHSSIRHLKLVQLFNAAKCCHIFVFKQRHVWTSTYVNMIYIHVIICTVYKLLYITVETYVVPGGPNQSQWFKVSHFVITESFFCLDCNEPRIYHTGHWLLWLQAYVAHILIIEPNSVLYGCLWAVVVIFGRRG